MHVPATLSGGHPAHEWFLVALRTYGYLALFGLIGAQDLGLPTVVPGAVLLIVAGYLASLHELNPIVAGLAAALGALSGSTAVFLLARVAGSTVLAPLRRFLRLDDERRARVNAFLARWGLAAWLLLRFLPGFRAALALVSGLSTMRYTRFALLTAAASAIWVYTFIFIGLLVGAQWRAASGLARVAGWLALGICLAAALVAISWRVARAHMKQQTA